MKTARAHAAHEARGILESVESPPGSLDADDIDIAFEPLCGGKARQRIVLDPVKS